MSLILTVHRGAHEIGGSCVEVAHPSGERLILDAGRPLDALERATGLLPASLDLSRPATALIGHPHQDHWGLVDELPADWPVWTGKGSAELIAITARVRRQPLGRKLHTWDSRSGPFRIGAFTVTPFLTDHSAFDACMLLVEGAGKRVLYGGDFRRHGRKGILVDRMMADPPKDLDVLILEGTNLGSDKSCRSEDDLEEEFRALFDSTPGRVFVCWSGQNIDRTVTLYRAALKSGRRLVVDLYTAEVLDRIGEGTRLPRAGFRKFGIVITKGLRAVYGRNDEGFIGRMVRFPDSLSAKRIGPRDVIMLRDSLVHDYEKAGVRPGPEDAFVWSMWAGYLRQGEGAHGWCSRGGARMIHLHTSGHAAPDDLRAFAEAMNPRVVVPVHGANWQDDHGIPRLHRLADGEAWSLA
ncbi:hypothetical protein ORIO_20935 (plasmid) [Cereibacter azotoformans]|uniref:MBL fold metallo-hydrolase n=1 Tax=Cereibacter azotoformans TaxID=43057 RepID=UPI001EEC6969|nr:MBL fold metallo-hydrolase [Cereibacter azotoformans]ULB12264.1 hypothetical protein ORIO_20935 [Cereibacter azotoformans]